MDFKRAILLAVGIFLLVNGACFYFLFYPKIEYYQELQQKLESYTNKLHRLTETSQALQNYESQKPVYLKNQEIYDKNVIAKFESSKVKIFLNQVGKSIKIENIFPIELSLDKPKTTETPSQERYKSVSYKIETVFTFHQLIEFLGKLTADDQLFVIKQLAISPTQVKSSKSKPDKILGEVTVQTPLNVEILLDFCYFKPEEKQESPEK
jgi:Tfp pilus assembly protein PilO